MKEFIEKFKKYVNHQERLTIVSNFIALGGSAVIACMAVIKENTNFLKSSYSMTIFLFALIVFAFSLLSVFIQIYKENFHIEALKYRETHEELKEQQLNMFILNRHIGQIFSLINMLINIYTKINELLFSEKPKEIFKSTIDDIIGNIIFCLLKPIFEQGSSALFSVALYLYNPKTGKLEDYSSKKDPLMGKEQKGRDWNPGDGHVGLAYQRKQILIHSDINTQLSPPPLNSRENDSVFYVSAITIPIFLANETGEDSPARGVFCITSSLFSCFENIDDSKPFLNIVFKIKQYFVASIACLLEFVFNTVFKNDLTEPFLYQTNKNLSSVPPHSGC